MRRIFQLSVLCIAAGVVGACRPDEVITTENIPTAGVRFINAVPDTQPVDFRFVDLVESNAHFRISFRNSPVTTAGVTASAAVQYKGARAGARNYRIFYNDTLQTVASTVINEGTMTIEAGKRYTVLLWGYAQPGGPNRPAGAPGLTVTIFEDADPPAFDPATQVALRVINASLAPIDAYYYDAATGTQPGTVIQANVAACCSTNSISSYVVAAPARYRFHIRPAGGTTFALADGLALIGAAAITDPPGPIDAIPGTTVAGSAVTAIIFPERVSGTIAPSFTITTGNSTVLTGTPTGYGRTSGSWRADGFFVGQQITASNFTQAVNNGASEITAIDTATTGSTRLSATATGYARPAGSFITNGFKVGMWVTASGFNATNIGRSRVTGVTATTLTVTKAGGTVAQAAQSGSTGRTIVADQELVVTKTGGTALEAGTTGAVPHLSATATGYARSTGDFTFEGFVVGMTVAASGFAFAANNGTSTVTAVTPTTLTVTKTGGTAVEAGSTGAAALGASSAGYTRTVGSFLADGFAVGHTVDATGFVQTVNNGTSTVTAVTATLLTVTKSPQTVTEVAAAGRTITTTSLRTIANGRNRTIAGTVGRLWSFVWDRRPTRPAGI